VTAHLVSLRTAGWVARVIAGDDAEEVFFVMKACDGLLICRNNKSKRVSVVVSK
jgi:hypothetical protein